MAAQRGAEGILPDIWCVLSLWWSGRAVLLSSVLCPYFFMVPNLGVWMQAKSGQEEKFLSA
jgi:hypothetical protein